MMILQRSLPLFLTGFLLISPLQAKDNSEALLELFQQITALGKEIHTLRGENEQLQHTIEKLKKVQKNGFLGIDERMDKLSKRIDAVANTRTLPKKDHSTNLTKPTVPTKKAETKIIVKHEKSIEKKPQKKVEEKPKAKLTGKAEIVVAPPHKIRTPTPEEKTAYNQAYKKVNEKPNIAIQSFRHYMKKYPESPLAANAQYWIGEVMYSQKNYTGAVDEFVKVLQNYRKSEKAPDAAIKLGFSFYELKNWVYARRALEDVNRYFPRTKAATLARQRIAKMKTDGKY
jgi:tol-pal system protein YbgF